MAAAFSTHSNACVSEYSDHNYYMFSVFNRDQTSPAYLYDIASYWQKYAGNTSSVNLSFYRWNKEDILKSSQTQERCRNAFLLGKPECLHRCLREVESQCPELRLEARTATDSAIADPLNNASKIYKGTQLKSQYALLRMRTNMMKGFHQQNITYWNAIASRLPKSPWREAMRNIYAEPCGKQGNITKHSKSMPSREIWQASECLPETIAILQASRAFISRIRTRQCSPIWCRIS